MPDLRFRRATVWILFCGAVLPALFYAFAQNNGGDAFTRAAITAKWLENPTWQLDAFGAYLPLHFWLMAGMTLITGDAITAGRLLSLILGVASVFVFWWLAHEVYDSVAANVSTLVFSLYSLHIAYCNASAAESPYLLFLLTGLACFFTYKRTSYLGWLASSGISLTLAAAIRYEAWVIIFAVGLVLIGSPSKLFRPEFWGIRRSLQLAVFGATAGAWPVLFMLFAWRKYRDPLYFVTMQKTWVAEIGSFAHHSLFYILAFFPGVLVLTLSPLALGAALYGLWLSRDEPSYRKVYLFIVLGFGAIQLYQLASGGTWPAARFTITLGTLLAVTSGFGIEQFSTRLSQRAAKGVYVALFLTLMFNLGGIIILSRGHSRFADKFRSISPFLQFPRRIEGVRKYLQPRLKPSESVVIDNYNCESNIVAAAIGLPLFSGQRAFLAAARIHSYTCESTTPLSAAIIRQDAEDLRLYTEKLRPKYVIYSDSGTLKSYLPLSASCGPEEFVHGMKFRCVFQDDIYSVYEVSYP